MNIQYRLPYVHSKIKFLTCSKIGCIVPEKKTIFPYYLWLNKGIGNRLWKTSTVVKVRRFRGRRRDLIVDKIKIKFIYLLVYFITSLIFLMYDTVNILKGIGPQAALLYC